MTCEYVNERRLHEYADGQLGGVALELVRTHVDSCKHCSTVVDQYSRIAARLRGSCSTARRDDPYDPWTSVAASLTEPDWFVYALADAIVLRDSLGAWQLVKQHTERLRGLSPDSVNFAPTVGYLAMWLVEMGLGRASTKDGSSHIDLVESILCRLPPPPYPRRSIADCVHIELAAALLALLRERNDDAIGGLRSVLMLAPRAGDRIVEVIARGSLSRAYARQGQYPDALCHVDQTVACALNAGYPELAAAYEVRKAWTLFQMEGPACRAAHSLLTDSSAVLDETEDCVSRGNISATRGKALSYGGRYEEARSRYDIGIELYEQFDASHPNLARAYVNRANVVLQGTRRLLNLTRAGTGGVGHEERVVEEPRAAVTSRLKRVDMDLAAATRLYECTRDIHGAGRVLVLKAGLQRFRGNYTSAAQYAANAYDLGTKHRDCILMARVRIEQCQLAHALSAAATDAPERQSNLERAGCFIEEAVRLVQTMHHVRLKVRAWIWQGLTFSHPYFGSRALAVTCLRRAREQIQSGTRDYIWDELQALENALGLIASDAQPVAPTLTERRS